MKLFKSVWERFFRESSSEWTAVLTAVLAISTVVLAVYTQKLHEATNRADETTKTIQRAFVTISDLEIKPLNETNGNTTWVFIPSIKNSGNTPTKHMQYIVSIVGGGGFPHDPDDTVNIDKLRYNKAIIGPQGTMPLSLIPQAAGIDTAILKEMTAKKSYEYITGVVHYRDIFSGSQPHVTKFCYEIRGESDDTGKISPSYSLCRHWNCADDECKDDKKEYDAEVQAVLHGSKKTGK